MTGTLPEATNVSDHNPDCHYVPEFETIPHSNQGKDYYPDRHWVQLTGTVPETKDVINHDPNCQVRGTVTNLETLLQANHISHPDPDRDPVQVRDPDSNLKFQGHHRGEGHYCQGYRAHLHQSVILLNNLCKGRKTRQRK